MWKKKRRTRLQLKWVGINKDIDLAVSLRLRLTWCTIMTGASESCDKLSSVSAWKSPNGNVEMYKRFYGSTL